ncbi:MAG: hypothetical protein PHY95_03800 [Candidatus ainarchaeum sp.]|nr:hypothetical protein [Candidatus ainarchaeum sp.]
MLEPLYGGLPLPDRRAEDDAAVLANDHIALLQAAVLIKIILP